MATLTLIYFANATGTRTAAQLAATMQGATYLPASTQRLLGVTLASQVGAVLGGQPVLTIALTTSATFNTRFPSQAVGAGPNAFGDFMTTRVASVIGQPVLGATVNPPA